MMNKRCINTMFVLLATTASAAYADGPVDSYDHGSTAVARTLSPNEYLVNADGAQEDPDHRMSDVARAYRNGMIAGRKEAEAKQQTAGMPPLPPDMRSVTVTPPLVSHRYVYAERSTGAAAPEATADVAQEAPPQYQAPQRIAQPPVQYVQQQNVYAPPPRYAAPQEYEEVEAYSPPPPPPPVYVQPEPRYIVVQRPRRMWATPDGYWQQGYYPPPQPMARRYAYQPY